MSAAGLTSSERLGAGLPALAMTGAVLIWGGSFIATKLAVQDVPPIAFAVMRFGLATVAMLLAHVLTRTPFTIPRAMWGRVVAVGLLGTTITYVLENIALKYTTAGNGALFIAASPLLTIVGARMFLGERLSVRQLAGAGLALAGIVPLVGAHLAVTGAGDALMALNALVGTFYGLLSKTLADRLPLMSTLTASFGVGVLGLLPCAGLEAYWTHAAWHLTPLSLGAVAYLGLGSSCLACWLWMYALARMPASTAGAYLFGMPVVTLLLSAVLLAEPFGPLKIVEAAVILWGVYLANGPRRVKADAIADEPHV